MKVLISQEPTADQHQHEIRRLRWTTGLAACSALLSVTCLVLVVMLLTHPTELYGSQASRVCQTCKTAADCQEPMQPWSRLLHQIEHNLDCTIGKCLPAGDSQADLCGNVATTRDRKRATVSNASRKLLANAERGLQRIKKRGRGAYNDYFGKRSLANLEQSTGHHYLNIHSHDRQEE